MDYILIGSQTSPFVRRIRMLMEEIPFEFQELNIYETQDALTLNKLNPINQIPVLIHKEVKVWDSRQIFTYLNNIHHFQNMTWEDENILTTIEGAMNSGVTLLLMKRSGIDTDEKFMFVQRQKERIESILDYLKPDIEDPFLKKWDFITMSLYSFLDWATFRNIVSLENRPECENFLKCFAEKEIVIKTQIPKG
jgi:glutathione S-transferase